MLRHDRVAEAIKQEVSTILHSELKDPRLGFVTITGVELSGDYRHAKITYSVLGKEEDYKRTSQALESARGFIRKLITERINLKFSPEIIFRQDMSSEYSVRIQQILDEIRGLENGGGRQEEAVLRKQPRSPKKAVSSKRRKRGGIESRKRNPNRKRKR